MSAAPYAACACRNDACRLAASWAENADAPIGVSFALLFLPIYETMSERMQRSTELLNADEEWLARDL